MSPSRERFTSGIQDVHPLTAVTSAILRVILRRYTIPLRADAAAHQRVLALAPHIDDETIGCGGALRNHILRSDDVRVIFLTDGGRSANAAENIVAMREAEAQAAVGEVLGVSALEFWRHPDGELANVTTLGQQISTAFRAFRPTILYLPCPWDPHPDHVATAIAAQDAVPHMNGIVRFCESFCPLTPLLLNSAVDISTVYPEKVRALQAFQSQVVSFESILLLNRRQANTIKDRSVRAVEAFLEIPQNLYSKVLDTLISTSARPRRISNMRNVLRAYLTNLRQAQQFAASLNMVH